MNERLEELAKRFFDLVLEICPQHPPVDFVVVTHLLEDRPWFLEALNRVGRIAAVIPKRKSIVPRVRDLLRHKTTLIDVSRSDLEDQEGIFRHLKPLQKKNPLCLLDIGGYFAPLAALHSNTWDMNVAGIIEDTENGHVKYEYIIANHKSSIPIYSVARSELKRPENFLVGQSLVYSAEAILRRRDELLHGRRACVIGYGNIGRSVAYHLHNRHVSITIFDNDILRLLEAFTHGFHTAETVEEALCDAEIVFCVTGNRSIGMKELRSLKQFTYIATVTSPDDEFRMDEIDAEIAHKDGHISELISHDGKILYLMNRGQAVNFVHGSVVGPFIQLLQGEIILTASSMMTLPISPQISSISLEKKRQLAEIWVSVYRH